MKWNVEDYNKNAAYVSKYGQDVIRLLSPKPKEHILDLGCGDGELAEKISLEGCTVIGIDSSEEMIITARKRGVDAHVIRGEEMTYQNRFDAVFSNAALHWITDADKVLDNVFRSLKPTGRFCGEMGGSGNVQTIINSIYNQLAAIGINGDSYKPWYFPNREEYARKLEKAGFHIKKIEKFDRPTQLSTDVSGWLKTFAKPFFRDVPQNKHNALIDAVRDEVSEKLRNASGEWCADYVRLRFLARKSM